MRRRKMIEDKKRSCRILVLVIAAMLIVTMMPATAAAASASGRWITKNGQKTAYVYAGGAKATGVAVISGRRYAFTGSGRLMTSSKTKRIMSIGAGRYMLTRDGVARSGFWLYGDALYYFSKTNGKMVKGKTVAHIPLDSTGKAYKTNEAALKKETLKVLDASSAPTAAGSTRLRKAYKYITSSRYRYALNTYPNYKHKYWPKEIAYKFLHNHAGNCYGFACGFAVISDTLGYDADVACGRVIGSRDGARDGYTRHGYDRINGRFYDPEGNSWAGGHWLRYCYGVRHYYCKVKSLKYYAYDRAVYPTSGALKKDSSDRYVSTIYKNELVNIGGSYYYFDSKGRSLVNKEKAIGSGSSKCYYYFGSKGAALTGLVVRDGVLYNFDSSGCMTAAEYAKYQAASVPGTEMSVLEALIGSPLSIKEYPGDSCWGGSSLPTGHDWEYKYAGFSVSVFSYTDSGTGEVKNLVESLI
jgi:glucan-binding YG repeat protein